MASNQGVDYGSNVSCAAPPGEPASDHGSPEGLIDHIISRYHEVHRKEFPELIRLAEKVEAVHRHHANVPVGLAAALRNLAFELEGHMIKEEHVLFPIMRSGGNPMLTHPILMMKSEHEDHENHLRQLEALTTGCVTPEGACRTWQALYAGLRKLIDDLRQHIRLENEVLFPQFESGAGR
ncbi:MAG TPA: hemerythrin domain-containing protein [Ferrovibrio sp.]|uniref:hemerythrin domain-containing protein n=1 Tax=Ferrovibrio sp. TaxID=1917215 RepID=UPI002ECFCCBE